MLIFSDPHLGLDRKSHTTKASRAGLKAALNAQTESCISHYAMNETVICAGDLFDSFSNSEEDLINAAYAAIDCDYVLAGNHDSLNQRDIKGSLDAYAALVEDVQVVKQSNFSEPYYQAADVEGARVALIPHHPSQELFEQAADLLVSEFDKAEPMYAAVFLHCNYENPMTDGHDISLNLTQEKANKLLEVADYIFVGHEHQPRELLDGRLIITGNIHPTSFSDISDKYVWTLRGGKVEKHLVWSMENEFSEVHYDGTVFPKISKAQFIDIVGSITADKGADLAEYINQCWEESGAYMIRNKVSIVMDNNVVIDAVDFKKLPEEIAEQLKGTELEPLWAQYWGMVKC